MATDVSPRARATATPCRPRRRPLPLGRWLLNAVVLGLFALLILVPAVALARQVLAGGWRPFAQAPATSEVRRAFGLSLGITVVVTIINTVFGMSFALVLVRQRFWGRPWPTAWSTSRSPSRRWSPA